MYSPYYVQIYSWAHFIQKNVKYILSLNAGYHISHSYKTLGWIIVLCILNLVVMDSGRDGSDRIIANYIRIILTSRFGNYSSWLYSHRNIDIISLHSTRGVCSVNRYTHSSEQVGKWKAAFNIYKASRHERTSHKKQ